MDTNSQVDHLVLYDGVCKFCNSSINFILDHEREQVLKFTPLQSVLGQSLLKKFELPLNYTDSLLLISHDEMLSHAQAAFKIATFLKAPWRWIAVFQYLPSFATNFFYKLIAKYRYKLMGRSEACMVPTPATKGRFLE